MNLTSANNNGWLITDQNLFQGGFQKRSPVCLRRQDLSRSPSAERDISVQHSYSSPMALVMTAMSIAFAAPNSISHLGAHASPSTSRVPSPVLSPTFLRSSRRWHMYHSPDQAKPQQSRGSKVRIGAIGALATAAGVQALPGIGRLYSAASIAAPLGTAVTTAAVKGVASDLFAQIVVERNARDLSLSRTLAFACFGAVYLGALAFVSTAPCARGQTHVRLVPLAVRSRPCHNGFFRPWCRIQHTPSP